MKKSILAFTVFIVSVLVSCSNSVLPPTGPGASLAPDTYEQGDGDNQPQYATNLFGSVGSQFEQSHTLHSSNDVDWFRINTSGLAIRVILSPIASQSVSQLEIRAYQDNFGVLTEVPLSDWAKSVFYSGEYSFEYNSDSAFLDYNADIYFRITSITGNPVEYAIYYFIDS